MKISNIILVAGLLGYFPCAFGAFAMQADSAPSVPALIVLYNWVDTTKPGTFKHNVDVKAGDRCSLLCVGCENSIFSGKDKHVIAHFGADWHIHIMHLRCREGLIENANPCPLCDKDCDRVVKKFVDDGDLLPAMRAEIVEFMNGVVKRVSKIKSVSASFSPAQYKNIYTSRYVINPYGK
jgi:hypothetical protein